MRPRPHTTNAAWNAMPPPSIEPMWLYPEVAEEEREAVQVRPLGEADAVGLIRDDPPYGRRDRRQRHDVGAVRVDPAGPHVGRASLTSSSTVRCSAASPGARPQAGPHSPRRRPYLDADVSVIRHRCERVRTNRLPRAIAGLDMATSSSELVAITRNRFSASST